MVKNQLYISGITSAPNPSSSITNHHITTPVNPTVISHHYTSAPLTSQQHLNSHSQQLNQDFINRLGQLEKLQYQLTKQELQYAQKFSPPKVKDVGQSDLRPVLKDSSSTLAASKSREMMSTGNSLDNKVLGSHDDPVLMSMSSVGGESIQEVWKMLDGQDSPSLITPRALPHSNKSGRVDKQDNKIQIEGQKTSLQTKDNKRPQSATTSKNIKLKLNKKPQARNYNVKDDRNR
ncbi:hypothetical protein LOTGIDRAFT_174116 [Lottia gigantea]|uniref:Uncharacterized protein n=1 Tax=Lottia gigantea TaxID=225164 RepID=V4AUM2_LOTGI|nr:hypothetical protein LOTGIDRAFT_174116 [Lottia gigantea]ESO98640.1 hypothetical protein LOTGIDRAFT_174116 [Lottia gigantea]